jgi:hypothetical protein
VGILVTAALPIHYDEASDTLVVEVTIGLSWIYPAALADQALDAAIDMRPGPDAWIVQSNPRPATGVR